MNTLTQDLRYGVRVLLSKPGFSSIAVLTLALGVAATTSIFSVVDAVLLRPLPIKNPNASSSSTIAPPSADTCVRGRLSFGFDSRDVEFALRSERH